VFANMLPADAAMQALIDRRVARPTQAKLAEKLAVTDGAAVPARQLQRQLATSCCSTR
jgi:hypothetical protein